MPVPAIIAAAAANFDFNSDFLTKTVQDLSPEEWLKSPSKNLNHTAWIVGHCIWARKRLLDRIGGEWSHPEEALFARGNPLADPSAFPSGQALLKTWQESAQVLSNRLVTISDEYLGRPVPPGPPSPDGKLSGLVNFFVIHETYHIGQASYLRSWMGKSGLME